MKYKRLVIILLSICFISFKLSAHPHMSITASCEFVFEETELSGFWVDFQFDQYFTADMIGGFDENKDLLFDSSETDEIYNRAFINLENYGFFISLREGTHRTSPTSVQDFSVRISNDLLVYRFFIEYSAPKDKEFYLSISDPSHFCVINYNEDHPVTFAGARGMQHDYLIEENTDYPVYFDPSAPATDNTSYDKWRPGLQTIYPREIHIVY